MSGDDNGVNRRRVETKDVLVYVTLLFQIAALVWGAATLNASVIQLKEATQELRATLSVISNHVSDLDARTRILEDRGTRRPGVAK